jgi:hypothetical protein
VKVLFAESLQIRFEDDPVHSYLECHLGVTTSSHLELTLLLSELDNHLVGIEATIPETLDYVVGGDLALLQSVQEYPATTASRHPSLVRGEPKIRRLANAWADSFVIQEVEVIAMIVKGHKVVESNSVKLMEGI